LVRGSWFILLQATDYRYQLQRARIGGVADLKVTLMAPRYAPALDTSEIVEMVLVNRTCIAAEDE
jgi:hypothetical protein